MKAQGQIAALVRVARLRSDMELKRFSAFRNHVAALDGRIAHLQDDLHRTAEGAVAAWTDDPDLGAPGRLQQARLAHALTRSVAAEREAALEERRKLTPRFEAARADALRAFGRAEVLDRIDSGLSRDRRAARDRREGGA